MLRFIIAILFIIIFLVLGIPVLLVEWVIGKFNRELKDYQCLRLVQFGFKTVLFICGTKVTVIGEENIPKDRSGNKASSPRQM